MEYHHIIAFRHTGDFTLEITFSNGEVRIIDFSGWIESKQDKWYGPGWKEHFADMELDGPGIGWSKVTRSLQGPDGEDREYTFGVDPLDVYRLSTPISDPLTVRFGQRIRNLRKRLGITQAELARRSGIPQPNISKIEKGKVSIELETMWKLLEVGLGQQVELWA